MTRPVLAAVQDQQKMIQSLQGEVARLRAHAAKQDLVVAFICKMAGVTEHVAAIEKQADAANPAQPIPDPPAQPPSETTEQARTPEASDDPANQGVTPGSNQNISADSTDVVLSPGQSLPTAPYGDLEDVSAPVEGTETHVPNDQTRTEVEVRVGDPTNPEQAYPWHLSSKQDEGEADPVQSSNRTMSSLHLARLRLASGIARGDDLEIAASIDSNASLSNDDITKEIAVLSHVTKAAAARQARPANLVPKAASTEQRTVPSLAGDPGLTAVGSAASVADDTMDSDLFD